MRRYALDKNTIMDDLLSVMKIYLYPFLVAVLLGAVPGRNILAAADPADITLRMANGAVVEGAMQEATPDGLVIQGEKGKYTAPWRYLSAGTRYRYELPLLAAQEVARSNALKKAAAAPAVSTTTATVTNTVGASSNTPPATK